MFLNLKYPEKLIDSTFKRFLASKDQNQNRIKPVNSPVLNTSHKFTIFTSLVILFVEILSSGGSYAMLTRPSKAADFLSSIFFFCSYRVNSLYLCLICALSVAVTFRFTLPILIILFVKTKNPSTPYANN